MLKELNGQEIWTDAFGERFEERVCVGVSEDGLMHGGKKFMPTKKEMEDLWEDYMTQEFGSKEQRMRELEEEFA